MFGYIRPEKDTLMVREYTIFRAAYCGICKEIRRTYGNIPRLALSYDMTVLAVFMTALSDEDFQARPESCILNPLKQKPVAFGHPALAFCAAACVLFTHYKLQDEIDDTGHLTARAGGAWFRGAWRKAAGLYPDADRCIREGIARLDECEKCSPVQDTYLLAADAFGGILGELTAGAFRDHFPGETDRGRLIDGIGRIGYEMGRWIYIMDAADDYDRDKKNYEWNPFSSMSREEALETASRFLKECEERCEEMAALLPYRRYAGIVSNIFRSGMPLAREKVLAGRRLERL